MKHVVLSGPSGVGKSTIAERLIHEGICERSISCTTRPKRGLEIEGLDYEFLTDEQFHECVKNAEFAEVEEIFGHLYGTKKKRIFEAKKPLVFVVDVDGMLSLKNAQVPLITIFILPPSLDSLRERLERRGANSAQEIQKRIERAGYEMAKKDFYDKQVVNLDLQTCYNTVKEYILSHEKSA
ncbi:guanylate kinase [bacterium]|jgi:guanylate kinase|nr:guanylate kinase [Chlamydiota bacterium]NDD99847.1 guanylate kinase [bacterium]